MKRTSLRSNSRWTPNEDVAIQEGIRKHFVGKISKYGASNVIADEVFMSTKMGKRTWEAIRQRARKLMLNLPSRKRRTKGTRRVPRPPVSEEDVMEIDGIVFESLPERANASTQTEDGDDDPIEVQPRTIDENMRSFREVLALQGEAIKGLIEDRNSSLETDDGFRQSFCVLREAIRKLIDDRHEMSRQVQLEINRQKSCFSPLVITAEILENFQSHLSSPEFGDRLESLVQRLIDRRSTKMIQDFLDARADKVISDRPAQWTNAMNVLKLRAARFDLTNGETK